MMDKRVCKRSNKWNGVNIDNADRDQKDQRNKKRRVDDEETTLQVVQ